MGGLKLGIRARSTASRSAAGTWRRSTYLGRIATSRGLFTHAKPQERGTCLAPQKLIHVLFFGQFIDFSKEASKNILFQKDE